MKKTISVSIGGFAFILEEDAHRLLEQYMEKVKRNLGSSPDTDEILSDVEGRIAELMTEYLQQAGRQVIDSDMVNRAIGVMGAPEDFNVTGEPVAPVAEPETEERSNTRALFRDTEEGYLGGVCAGLAHYLGWDPLAVRLIFLALLFGFGSGVIVYVIMWILVPPANTTSEKLRMQGKPVNLESIKERFENFGEEVKELGRNLKEGRTRKRRGSALGKRFEESVGEIGRVLGTVIGIFFLLLGGFLCFWLFSFFTGSNPFPGGGDHFFSMVLSEPMLLFESSLDFKFLYWGIITLILLFIINLFRSGIRLLFHIPLKNRYLKGATAVVSILAVISIIYGAVNLGRQFQKDETVLNVNRFESKPDTLYLLVDRDTEFSDRLRADELDSDELVKVKDQRLVFGYPMLFIRKDDNHVPRLEVEKSAHGVDAMQAIRHSESLSWPVEISGDSILLQPFFSAPLTHKFRSQQVNANLFIPVGTVVILNEYAYRVLSLGYSDTGNHFWEGSPYGSRAFIMEKGGLAAL